MAAIGEQILGPTDVSLSNWTVRPSSGCSVVLATRTAGAVSVDGYTLTLAANPWNIVRTYNLTPGRELLFACLQLRGVHVRGRQRLRPIVRQLCGRPERLEHGQDVLHRAAKRSCEAALWGALPGAGPAQPDGRNGGRLWPPDPATLEAGNTAEEEVDTAALALLLKHEFLDGGADDVTLATLGKVLLEPNAHHVRQFSGALQQPELRSFTAGGFQLEGYAMTLSAFAWEHRPHLHSDAGETLLLRLPAQAGHGLQLGDVRQRGRQRLRGRHLPRHGRAGRLELDFSVPPGGVAKLHFGAFGGSISGLVQQSAGTLDLYSLQIRATAFEGESVSVTDLLADTLDGLTAQHNVGCDQLLCSDVNCTDVFTTGVDASGAVSCAALTFTGAVSGATLTSTGAVSGSSLSIRGGQRGPAELGHWNHRQHSHHQQHG